jgi:hypothetical protein
MFTIGIFTTHIPYIAFVMFYAFFLLFGVNKASAGEIQWDEHNIFIESATGKTYVESATGSFSNFHYQSNADFFSPGTNEFLVFKKKLQHTSYFCFKKWNNCFHPALFGRPPPTSL